MDAKRLVHPTPKRQERTETFVPVPKISAPIFTNPVSTLVAGAPNSYYICKTMDRCRTVMTGKPKTVSGLLRIVGDEGNSVREQN